MRRKRWRRASQISRIKHNNVQRNRFKPISRDDHRRPRKTGDCVCDNNDEREAVWNSVESVVRSFIGRDEHWVRDANNIGCEDDDFIERKWKSCGVQWCFAGWCRGCLCDALDTRSISHGSTFHTRFCAAWADRTWQFHAVLSGILTSSSGCRMSNPEDRPRLGNSIWILPRNLDSWTLTATEFLVVDKSH